MIIERIHPIKITLLACLLFSVMGSMVHGQTDFLIPTPQEVNFRTGSFYMNEFIPVFLDKNASAEDKRSVWLLCNGYEDIFGKPLSVTHRKSGRYIIINDLSVSATAKHPLKEAPPFENEGYQINILPEKIEIVAGSQNGVFYGIQTLLQIFRAAYFTGTIRCMTINDKPSFKQRSLYYQTSIQKQPSLDFITSLIQLAAHFKYNSFIFNNDSLPSPFSDEQLFYLKNFSKTCYVDFITDHQEITRLQSLSIDMQDNIYPKFDVLQQSLYNFIAKADEGNAFVPLFRHSEPVIFLDYWYPLLWVSELLWKKPENTTADSQAKRKELFETALNRQFFQVEIQLAEKLQDIDSLLSASLFVKECFTPVKQENSHASNIAHNQWLLKKALELENSLLFFIENFTVQHDEILYSMLFAIQRIEFISLKRLLQESIAQENPNAVNYQKEVVTLLQQSALHLKQAHEALWQIENNNPFPQSMVVQYDHVLLDINSLADDLSSM